MPPPPVPRRPQKHGSPAQPKSTPAIVKAIPKVVQNPPPRVPVRIIPKQSEGDQHQADDLRPVQQKTMPKPRITLKEATPL
eukprot:6015777-Amphidinium_carterae.1